MLYAHSYCDEVPPAKEDGTWTKLEEMPGCNGTPPMVYGVSWNPSRPQVRPLASSME